MNKFRVITIKLTPILTAHCPCQWISSQDLNRELHPLTVFILFDLNKTGTEEETILINIFGLHSKLYLFYFRLYEIKSLFGSSDALFTHPLCLPLRL